MALQQINKSILSSPASAIEVTGIDSDNVYMLTIRNLEPVDNAVYPLLRFIVGGSAVATTDYAYANKNIKSAVSFSNMANSSQTQILLLSEQNGNAGQEKFNGICYIYNANDSSEYTNITSENVALDSNTNALGSMGGGTLLDASAVEGVSVLFTSGNVAAGAEMVLYKVLE